MGEWPYVGIKLSNELADAVALCEAARWFEVGHKPAVRLEGATPENIEDRIRELADELLPTLQVDYAADSYGSISTLSRAKLQYHSAAAHRVVRLAAAEVPAAIEQIKPKFDEVVASYIDAVDLLPEDLDEKSLVTLSPDALSAYAAARGLAAKLNRFDRWAASLASLPGHGRRGNTFYNVLQILRPETYDDAEALQQVKSNRPVNEVVGAIGPVWLTAVRRGVEFALNTPADSNEVARALAEEVSGYSFN
ncbi:hypothetical protein [Mycobacterium sp. C31M]